MTSRIDLNRRAFLATGTGLAAFAATGRRTWADVITEFAARQEQQDQNDGSAQVDHDDPYAGSSHRGACAVASGNGRHAVTRALDLIHQGADPADAVVAGVNLVESDPSDMSVGYGGLPNEDGVVELDSSVMHGPTHKAGAVAALRNIMNPASVALKVLRTTDHVMLVGEGALRFARAHGFEEMNLLTPEAREVWLKWKSNLNPNDDWLDESQRDALSGETVDDERIGMDHLLQFTYGTINCCAVTDAGDVAGVTTTSGLSFKIPGRVGDSPIIGAGLFVDNEIGAAGATGRGEAVIQNCSSYAAVQAMKDGKDPTAACLEALQRIVDNTKQKRLRGPDGRPSFNVSMYAVRKDGAYGSASIWGPTRFAVNTGNGGIPATGDCLYTRPNDGR
ncbi:MAG: asparaginase [Planctomycetes bacterium]|nr:asparaginase [Planctomycetota bacterium]NOG56031.1 N(4)-(beta-N-acetylglucosaminyl)-L-asparaginase [Planctomycetota bacterium]